MVDQLADHLARAQDRDLPVLPWLDPEQQRQNWALTDDALAGGAAPEAILARFLEASQHLHHPRYMGHQVPPPLPLAALADLTAALMNNSVAVYEMSPAATAIEAAVVQWMTRALSLGDAAGGVLTSGGSLGALRGLLAARAAFDADVDANTRLGVAVGAQAHYSVTRAARVMGLPPDAVIAVPVDEDQRMTAEALERSLDSAAQRGLTIFAVVASSGSTATGSFDPLQPIAQQCQARGLWLHVDGAHGAAAALSPRHRHLVAGIERADSVVWDAHKMLMVPSLVTGVLFKDAGHCLDTFTQEASYLLGPSAREEWFNLSHQTLECTKNAMALKLYLLLRASGESLLTAHIERTFGLAAKLADLVQAADDFELALLPSCNIVCFRHLPSDAAAWPGAQQDALQARAREALRGAGTFYLVQTALGGRTYLRTTLMNPLTTSDDLIALLEAIREAGQQR